MGDRLPFGARVRLTATVEPRYLRQETERVVYDHPVVSGFTMGRDVPVDPPVLVCSDREWEPIGDPIPGTAEVPDKGVHRRLRRFFDGLPVEGLVVGWVLRAEGEYWAPSGGFDPYTGEHDHDPGGLAETGRHRLYQVVVDPGEVGMQFHPARIVLAHPDDMKDLA